MDPKIWGKCFWTTLFSIALGYPINPTIDEQHHYTRFFYHLRYTIPCEVCRINFENHIRNVPLNFYLHNRKVLLDWVLILHNEVNKTLGKSPITHEEAIQRYLRIDPNDQELYVQCLDKKPDIQEKTPDGTDIQEKTPDGTITEHFISGNAKGNAKNDSNLLNPNYKDITIILLVILLSYFLFFKARR